MGKLRSKLGEFGCFPKVEDVSNNGIVHYRQLDSKAGKNPISKRQSCMDCNPKVAAIKKPDRLQTHKVRSKLPQYHDQISKKASHSKAARSCLVLQSDSSKRSELPEHHDQISFQASHSKAPARSCLVVQSDSCKSKRSEGFHSPVALLEDNISGDVGAKFDQGMEPDHSYSSEYFSPRETPLNVQSRGSSRKPSVTFRLESPERDNSSNQDDGLGKKTAAVDEECDHSARRDKDGNKERSWNVLATVNNEVVRKKVIMRRKTEERKKLLPPDNIADAPCTPSLQLLKRPVVVPQKQSHARITNTDLTSSEGRLLREGGESRACSFRLGTSSVEYASIEAEHCLWDKDLASFASENSALFHSSQEQVSPGRAEHVRSNSLHKSKDGDCIAATFSGSIGQTMGSPSLIESYPTRLSGFDEAAAILLKKLISSRKGKKARGVAVKIGRKKTVAVKINFKGLSRKPASHDQKENSICSSENLESLSRRQIGSIPTKRELQHSDKYQCLKHSDSAYSPKLLSSEQSLTASPKRLGSRRAEFCSTSYRKGEIRPPPSPYLTSKLSRIRESVAVIKRSHDPFQDFRDSMLEMIHKKNLREAADLEELLRYYVSLNPPAFRDLIITVFEDICDELFNSNMP